MFYEDDHFPQNNFDDEDAEGNDLEYYQLQSNSRHLRDSSEYSVNTLETYRKNQRKNADEYKMIDKGYRKMTISSKGQRIDVEYYQTLSTPGNIIRDAITGARSREFRVGSKEEDLFFKVRLAIGKVDNDSALLFYDSPEVYEGHMHTTVSPRYKEIWRNKCAIARNAYSEKTNSRSGNVTVR